MLSTIYIVFYLGVPFSFRCATFEVGLYQGTPFGSRPLDRLPMFAALPIPHAKVLKLGKEHIKVRDCKTRVSLGFW